MARAPAARIAPDVRYGQVPAISPDLLKEGFLTLVRAVLADIMAAIRGPIGVRRANPGRLPRPRANRPCSDLAE